MNKSIIILSISLLSVIHKIKAQTMDSTNFKSETISKAVTIELNANIKTLFPLFGAFEERKWAEHWNPALIYPATETIEEGTTFITHAHNHDEQQFLWRVSKYDAKKFIIQYFVSSENRCWTITIQCHRVTKNKTTATIAYTFIGLNETGNELNQHSVQSLYKNNLNDWAEAINYYLQHRKMQTE